MRRAAAALGAVALVAVAGASLAHAGETVADLAKAEQNPLAHLAVVPLQGTWSVGVGPDDERLFALSLQPVIPFPLTERWRLVLRPAVTVVDQPGFAPGTDDETSLVDLRAQLFLTPGASDAFVWGVGVSLGFPTMRSERFGSGKWTAGPAAVVLRQSERWTYGVVASQDSSYAGSGHRADVSVSAFQGFLARRFPGGFSLALRPTGIANWESDDDRWTVPLDLEARKVFVTAYGGVSVGVGFGYFVERPAIEADWRMRLILTFLLPRRR